MFLKANDLSIDVKSVLMVCDTILQKIILQTIAVFLLVLFSMQVTGAAELKSNLQQNTDHFTVYLSPFGDDDNNGLSLASPIMSLQKAHDILLDYQPQRPVDIVINAGTYYFQEVKWRYTNGHKITFKAFNQKIERPVFDGSLVSDTWFTFDSRDGEASYLNFRHLKVQNYNVGMTFRGDRENIERWNGYNELYSMYFYRIGGMFYSARHSTAAVRFINSRNNKIRNSHFVDILNRSDTAHLIHPVYLAHYSSDNEIIKNRFLRSNGNPIAIRDASNFNMIQNNRFIQAGNRSILQDWYCVQGRHSCTKQVTECPSVGNRLAGNEIYRGYFGEIRFFELFFDSNYCGRNSEARLRTAINLRK